MKTIASLILSTLLLSCTMPCWAENPNVPKLKKPVFVASKDSSLFALKCTDSYDSTFYFSYEVVMNGMGNIHVDFHYTNSEGEKDVYRESYGFIGLKKFVFRKEGYQDTDTLYAWHVPLIRGDKNEVMLNNEGTSLKIFGKRYGKNVSVSTPDNTFIAKKAITDGMTEFQIPQGVEVLNIDIECDEQKHYTFAYPVR